MDAPGFPFGIARSEAKEKAKRNGITLGRPLSATMERFGISENSTWKADRANANRPRAGEIAMPIISGTTRNGDGSTLGSVEVRVYYIGGEATQTLGAFIKATTSDGSGLWTMDLAPGYYQFDGYLFGSPDKAGTTKVNVTSPSTSVNIYMRDPTAADAPGGSAVYRPIGSPIVRRLES